jgi:hypothetical protein
MHQLASEELFEHRNVTLLHRDILKKKSELDPDVLAFDEPRSHGPSADDLVQALQRIPASQREALVMRELEGRTYREIAETLGLSSSALESRLFRARRSLARELADSEPCDGVEAAMSKQLDGRLPRGEKKTLEQHLRACPGCRQLYVHPSLGDGDHRGHPE